MKQTLAILLLAVGGCAHQDSGYKDYVDSGQSRGGYSDCMYRDNASVVAGTANGGNALATAIVSGVSVAGNAIVCAVTPSQ